MNCAAEPFSGTGDNGDEELEVDELDVSSALQTNPLRLQGDDLATMKDKQSFYACFVCGKVYIYLVSFKKHLQMHENSSEGNISDVHNLNKYECPDCGMTFVRRTRLLSHLHQNHKSSKQVKLKAHRCDQCNKDFCSTKSWMSHVETHKERPFWCLTCAKGFRDEKMLDKHLQDHSLMQHKCHICSKRFQTPEQLVSHYNTHTEVQLEVVPGNDESPVKSESHDPCEDAAEFGDHVTSEESDCGEPMHNIRVSKAFSSAGSDSPESKSHTVKVKSEPQEGHTHRDHKYWEWECFDCDMGFDDLAMLHLHYIKHARGELPFQQVI